MRHSYSTSGSGSSGFSTIFGDLVFGLLFVFFLLAIALVFNRPTEGAFDAELKDLEKALALELQELEAVQKRHAALTTRLAGLQKQTADKDRRLAELTEKKEEREKQIALSLEKLRNSIATVEKALANWRRNKENIEAALSSLLDSQIKDRDVLKKELQREKNRVSAMGKEIARLKQESGRVKDAIARSGRTTAEIDAILATLKALLTRGGYPEILAEVEVAEKEVHAEREGRRPGPPENEWADTKLMAQYDPDRGLFQARLMEGDAVRETYGKLGMDQLLNVCRQVMGAYERGASEYTKEQKLQHRPRVYLSVPPAMPYRDVEEILKTLQKIIPVTIAS